jgi:NTP pyrophosphatase (non-canonical NTP hydrolase)
MRFSNNLNEAQLERLALLAEELGEAVQVIGKIIRHGYDSINPKQPDGPTNRAMLEHELGDVAYAVQLMADSDDISALSIDCHRDRKEVNVKRYLHHQ